MLSIENSQAPGRIALLHLGFRPFFLGAGVFAVASAIIWMAIYTFGREVRLNGLSPMAWHAHEMVFGYSMAVVAGFLLTAVRNWTGIQTLHGTPLALLFMSWAAARLIPFFGRAVPIEVMAALDTLFLVILIIALALPIVKVKQWKQIGILSKLFLLLASNLLFYAGVLGLLSEGERWGLYSGFYLIIALIFVMGRRVIPLFIEKGVGYPVQLRNRKWLDIASLVLFLAFWVLDILRPDSWIVALLAGILCLLHALRLAGWHTPGIWKKPLLWVLYLAYGALVAGFALKVAVYFLPVSPYLAVHAFAFGGIGMMTLGMMSRVALGHTGRNVFAPPRALLWVFAVLFLGALVRVVLPLADPAHYALWIGLSQTLWIVAFSLFLYLYAPMLVLRRIDGRFG